MPRTRPAIVTDPAAVPLPRRLLEPGGPLDAGGPGGRSDAGSPGGPGPGGPLGAGDRVRRWYEDELGWPVVSASPGSSLCLRVGPLFDVLDVPAEAGRAALRHLAPGSPVAVQGDRMRLLIAAGAAAEVPGVLDWLEWGTLPLDLTALGEDGLMAAPLPPEWGPVMSPRPSEAPGSPTAVRCSGPSGPCGARLLSPGPCGAVAAVRGAAVWLRPPEPADGVAASLAALPTLSALGGGGGAPDLVRVLGTLATQCHRLRLLRARRPPAGSPPG